MCYGSGCQYETYDGDCKLSGYPKRGAVCLDDDEDEPEQEEE